jgi:predicted N-acetyltransferase YhbS
MPASTLDVTISAENANDAQAIERLHERSFGPGRFALTAYRLREHVTHDLSLSFTARLETLLVASVRMLPVCVGDTKAFMLGPLAVEPPFRGRGIARGLIERSLAAAKAKGHRLVVLIGNEPIYGRFNFKTVPRGQVTMLGPVDPARILFHELVEGAFDNVSGAIAPDWDAVKA